MQCKERMQIPGTSVLTERQEFEEGMESGRPGEKRAEESLRQLCQSSAWHTPVRKTQGSTHTREHSTEENTHTREHSTEENPHTREHSINIPR